MAMETETRDAETETRYVVALGKAVIRVWGELPQDVQQQLFENAVAAGHHTERDESLREQLAAFLHDQHPRTEQQ